MLNEAGDRVHTMVSWTLRGVLCVQVGWFVGGGKFHAFLALMRFSYEMLCSLLHTCLMRLAYEIDESSSAFFSCASPVS